MPVPWRVQGAAACRKFPWRHGRKCVPLHHQATRKNGQATDRRPVSLSTVAMEGPSCETEVIPGKDITQCLLSKARPMLPGEKRGSKAAQGRHDLHPHTTSNAPQAASCRGWLRKTLPSEGCCVACRPTTGTSGENPRLFPLNRGTEGVFSLLIALSPKQGFCLAKTRHEYLKNSSGIP